MATYKKIPIFKCLRFLYLWKFTISLLEFAFLLERANLSLLRSTIYSLEKAPGSSEAFALSYKEIVMFFLTLSGNSSSSNETLRTKSIFSFSLIFSSFSIVAAMSPPSKQEILRKLSKYICCKSWSWEMIPKMNPTNSLEFSIKNWDTSIKRILLFN